MSKRNFTLLIIVLIIVLAAIFGFLFFNKTSTNTTGTTTTGTNFFSQFNPFASTKKTTTPTTTTPVNVSGYQPPVAENVKLKKVSSMPIAGYTVFGEERLKVVEVASAPLLGGGGGEGSTQTNLTPALPKGKGVKPVAPLTELVSALRYVARATGNIYETFADNISEKQFSSTVIPKVYDAYLGNKGQSVAMRYLQADGKTIETFLGILPKEPLGGNTSAVNITGSLLPNNVEDISISPDTGNLFYLFDSGDEMVGTTINLTTNKKVQIFDSPFTEWLSWWPNSKIITLTTKPAASVPGYMYEINGTNGKNFNEVLGNINGLTTEASPDGKLILYADDNLSLNIYNPTKNLSTLLGVKSLPEKCVWGSASDVIYCAVPKSIDPGQQYPDAWYQGEVSFSDSIWKIEAKTGLATQLLDPVTAPGGGEEIDGIKLMLDSSQNYLFFVNKKDSYLWEFNLK
jgi:hypothetical protein